MANLRSELARLMAEARRQPRRATLDEAAAKLGGNPGIAELLSGTSDKRSPAYKAALRSVQRYRAMPGRQQRNISDSRLNSILAALGGAATVESMAAYLNRHYPLITIDAEWFVSEDRRNGYYRTVRGLAIEWTPVVPLWVAKRFEEAEFMFEESIGSLNGFGAVPQWGDIEIT